MNETNRTIVLLDRVIKTPTRIRITKTGVGVAYSLENIIDQESATTESLTIRIPIVCEPVVYRTMSHPPIFVSAAPILAKCQGEEGNHSSVARKPQEPSQQQNLTSPIEPMDGSRVEFYRMMRTIGTFDPAPNRKT